MPATTAGLNLDTTDFAGAVAALPDRIRAAATNAADVHDLPAHEDIAGIVIVASGVAAVDADIAAAIATEVSPVPIVTHRGAELPNWVDSSVLVIVAGGQFGDAEAIEALGHAHTANAPIVVLASAGPLLEAGKACNARCVIVDHGDAVRPLPGVVAVSILKVLDACGLYPGADQWITSAIDQMQRRHLELTQDRSESALLARRIGRTMPIIYAGGDIGSAAAGAWKSAINLGAKLPAYFNTVPDLCFEEVAGFGQNGDVTRQVFTLVLIRHDHEHPGVVEHFAKLPDLLDEIFSDVQSLHAKGDGPLTQLFDLTMVGLHLSLDLARIARVDPGPVPIVEELNQHITEN